MKVDIPVSYYITNVSAHPFENPHVKEIIDRVIRRLNNNNSARIPGRIHICDPFSNNKTIRRQGTTLISNDLNPEYNSTYNLEANDFGELMERDNRAFDLILWDPPYSLNQLKKHYDGIGKDLEQWQTRNMWGRAKDALAKCLIPGAYVISFGWHSKGFGRIRGLEKKELHVLTNSGRDGRYDLLITVEQKVDSDIFAYISED